MDAVGFVSGIGAPEVIIVLVIALVIFGPKRLPDLGRSLGSGMRNFKDSVTGKDEDEEAPAKIASSSAHVETVDAPTAQNGVDAPAAAAAKSGAETKP